MTLLLIFPFETSAHPLDLGLLDIRSEGQVVLLKLDLHPTVVAQMKDVFQETLGSGILSSRGSVCDWKPDKFKITQTAELATLTVEARCPSLEHDLALDLPFLKKQEPTFNLIIKLNVIGNERVLSMNPQSSLLKVELDKETESSFIAFTLQGIRHIGVSKDQWMKNGAFRFPPGIDHILFLLALVLSGGTFMGLIRLVTGFTLGHTISAGLAAFHIVNIPGHFIEPIIALTIALVALDGHFQFGIHKKWLITTFIGLIHGLAFAEALVDLDLSTWSMLKAVAGFNLGVELAQAILIGLLFPLIYVMRKKSNTRRYLIPVLSFFMVGIGLYWFVDRMKFFFN